MSEIMARDEETALTEQEIVAWLRRNPRFLQKNPDILDDLLPPRHRQGKGIVDFQYYMVERLRADRDEVLESTREIVENSRANMNNLARIHKIVLMILEARNFEDFIRTITMDAAAVLDVDIISLIVETEGGAIPHIDLAGVRTAEPGTIDLLMKDKTIILESGIAGLDEIYGGGSGLVRSQALMRLHIAAGTPPLLLAFGSRNAALFHERQATDLVMFLGQVIERCFLSWLTVE